MMDSYVDHSLEMKNEIKELDSKLNTRGEVLKINAKIADFILAEIIFKLFVSFGIFICLKHREIRYESELGKHQKIAT